MTHAIPAQETSEALTTFSNGEKSAKSSSDSTALYEYYPENSGSTKSRRLRIPFPDGSSVLLAKLIEELPSWLMEVTALIYQGSKLEPNWDGYGGIPVHADCVFDAINLLSMIASKETLKPYVFATPEGGIQLEWHNGSADLEIEITKDCHIIILFTDLTADPEKDEVWEQRLHEDISKVIERTKNFNI